jgi:4-amino-4-deoxy-L-arabinose transferase-like glycosyltransferase
MLSLLSGRLGHYLLLLTVCAGLFLPRLGEPSLWDIDEGHNAQCAREMYESGDWIKPTFNFDLRVDKPALLYWLQIFAYQFFGINEFAARLPSALAAMLTVLLTYELGRRMFGAGSGLLAGLVLASTLLFCGSAHFANPDALLNATTVLTFFLCWRCFERSEDDWPALAGVSTGLGFLAKGPVGLVLPLAVVGLYLLWCRQLRRLRSDRVLVAAVLFGLVALPWFGLVGAETKGDYLRGFFLTHNRDRFLAAMEGHRGPFYYHALSLIIGFLPWSVFLGPAIWYAVRESTAESRESRASNSSGPRFLACWIAVYFAFFSISQTKLPNYILPIYPPIALLVGHFLNRWREGAVQLDGWAWRCSLTCWMLAGIGVTAGLLIAGGAVEMPLLRGRRLPGLEDGAVVGILLLLGALAAWLCLRWQARTGALVSLCVTAVPFVGLMAAWGAPALDLFKAPRALVEASGARQIYEEVQVGCFEWYQPSLVFYCERKVERLEKERQALEFLECPLPVYLFLPATVWDRLAHHTEGTCHVVARHWDLYRNCDVVVVTNH